MESQPQTPRLNKNFYTKMSATATKEFSEEMQKRRKPFLLNESEAINSRISIKKSNKENTVRPSTPYNKNHLKTKALQSSGRNLLTATQYRTNMDCPVLHKYHHKSSKALKEINSNSKATYPDSSPGKIEIENIPIKTNCLANESHQGKTSIDLYQTPTQNNKNQNITSDVEQLLKMHKEMTELKQKLEEKYKNTLKHRDQLISYGTINNRTSGTEAEDNIMAAIQDRIDNEAPNSPTNIQGTSELLTTTTLLSLAKASGFDSQSQQRLSLITDEPYNAKRETLNGTVKLFTKLLKSNGTNGNETNEIQTFTEVTSKETVIAGETGNSKRDILIRKVNLLRNVMVLTSRASGGNDTSGYQSLTEEDFNNYKIEHLTNSTPSLTTTKTNSLEANGNETDRVSFEPQTNSSLFATAATVADEISAVKEETNSALKTPTETSGNETAKRQRLFTLNEALKNAKTLADNLESLTNLISSCTEETSGIETSLVTKGGNKLDIESINRCLELLINEFLTTTETNRIETTENEMKCNDDLLGLITKEMNSIGEENLNTILNCLKTTLETNGNETAKCPNSQKLNKEKYNGNKDKALQALQITITVKETCGIETPRYLTQLISELNKTNGIETAHSQNNQHLRQSRLKRNLPYICNKIETISQIPKEIIKIPKKYLTYRAKNTKNSFVNKESRRNEAKASPGYNGEKETRVDKNSRLKLNIPTRCLHNLKNFVKPKRCMNDKEQKGHNEMEHFKKTEGDNKAMAELLDNKEFPHLRKLPGECGPKQQIDVEQYGGMLYGLWDAVKKYPINESKNDRESKENREEQLSNRGENRKMNLESGEDKREEKINAKDRKVEILKQKIEDKIKEKEKKYEKNEGGENAVQQSQIIAKKELEKQEVLPKGSQYSSNKEKIPKKKYNFRKSLCNYFAKEEKPNATDAKNTAEDCATQENDPEDRCDSERMAEHFTQMFHI